MLSRQPSHHRITHLNDGSKLFGEKRSNRSIRKTVVRKVDLDSFVPSEGHF